MSNVYLIVEADFEYNDEGYNVNDGTTPVRAFKKRASAEAECFLKNSEWLSNHNIGEYGDEAGDIFNEPEIIENLLGIYFEDDSLYEFALDSKFSALSDDDKKIFVGQISERNLAFKLVEVELG